MLKVREVVIFTKIYTCVKGQRMCDLYKDLHLCLRLEQL